MVRLTHCKDQMHHILYVLVSRFKFIKLNKYFPWECNFKAKSIVIYCSLVAQVRYPSVYINIKYISGQSIQISISFLMSPHWKQHTSIFFISSVGNQGCTPYVSRDLTYASTSFHLVIILTMLTVNTEVH